MTDQIEQAAQEILQDAAAAVTHQQGLTEAEVLAAEVLGFPPDYYLALKTVRNIEDWRRLREVAGDPKEARR